MTTNPMDSPELKVKLDELAALWNAAEAALCELKPVVPAEYDIPKSRNKDVIAFRKLGDRWRICVLYDDVWRPIVDCPVHDRVEFVEHFPGLRKKVIAVSEKTLAGVKVAIDRLKAVLGDLEKNGYHQPRKSGSPKGRTSTSKAAPVERRGLRRKNRM